MLELADLTICSPRSSAAETLGGTPHEWVPGEGDIKEWRPDRRAGGLLSLLVQLVPTSVSIFDVGCGRLQITNCSVIRSLAALGNTQNAGPSSQAPARSPKAKSKYVIYLSKAAIGQEMTIKHTF